MQELEQFDQAVATYNKAVEAQPDHLQGWQGLAKIFEGKVNKKAVAITDEDKVKHDCLQLANIYRNMTRIHNSEKQVDKSIQISSKLANLYANK